MNNIEIWKNIIGYENRYLISNFGNVESLITNKILKQSKDKDGYRVITIRKIDEIKRKTKKIHRLVLETFIGICPNGYEAGHLDGNKDNNNIINLKWITPSENGKHKIIHGTSPKGLKNGKYTHPEKVQKGDDINTSKLTEKDVINIRKLYKTTCKNLSELGRKFGVTHTAIRFIIIGKNWKHI